jgi:UvrD-like helicase family protein
MRYSSEQLEVIETNCDAVVTNAFAGAGKTSTMVGFAVAREQEKMLYVAYNRSIRDEASRKFPKNVECVTSHQLAYKTIGHRYRDKLESPLTLSLLRRELGIQSWSVAKAAMLAVRNYMSSADDDISQAHFGYMKHDRFSKDKALEYAHILWSRMTDPNDPLPTEHDAYLKQYQLAEVDLGWKYQHILFDEAQDANPVTTSIITRQDCKLLLVGDRHQQIYRFRGAQDALNAPELDHAERFYLTNSFRFGPAVAEIANKVLAHKGEERKVHGLSQDYGYAGEDIHLGQSHAIISRTVTGVLEEALTAAQSERTVYWVGGMKAYNIGSLCDLHRFRYEQYDKMFDQSLVKEFGTFKEYEAAAKESDDQEMNRRINILNQLGNIPALAAQCKQSTVTNIKDADVVVTTAHRSKGLEFDEVRLGTDFPTYEKLSYKDPESVSDELNLIYVAATRAQKKLSYPAPISQLLNAKVGKLQSA